MARSRLVLLLILLTLVFSACSPEQAALVVTPTATPAVHPTATVPPPTSSPVPSTTAVPSPSPTPLPPTATQTSAPTTTPVPDTAIPSTATPTVGTNLPDASSSLPSLGCTNLNDPNIQITVPDGIAPYKIFCSGIFGTMGVGINALDATNKLDPKAVFAVPIKVCLKGRGKVTLMDMFGSFGSKQLKSTQEGSFTCAEITSPGTVTLTQ